MVTAAAATMAATTAVADGWQDEIPITQDAVLVLEGRVSDRERDEADPPLFLERVELLETFAGSGKVAVQIELEFGSKLPEDVFSATRSVAEAHPGPAPLELKLGRENGAQAVVYRSRSLRVDPGFETIQELRGVLGRSRIRLVRNRSIG